MSLLDGFRAAFTGSSLAVGEEILDIFLEETPERLQALNAAMQADDAETAAQVVHGLANTLGSLRVTPALEEARALEHELRTNGASDRAIIHARELNLMTEEILQEITASRRDA